MKLFLYTAILLFPFHGYGMAATDVMVGYAVHTALAQEQALQAEIAAIAMQQAQQQYALRDMMLNYDYTYEAMQDFQVAQKCAVDLPMYDQPADYLLQTADCISQTQKSLKIVDSVVVQDVRGNAMQSMSVPYAYKNEFKRVDAGVKDALCTRSDRRGVDKHGLYFNVSFNSRSISVKEGFTCKDIRHMIRHSKEAKRIIERVNKKFLDVGSAFEKALRTKNFDEVLKLLDQIRTGIQDFKKLEPISYLLIPEIEDTLQNIEWPLLHYALGYKDCLKPRDFEQIAWALECHFKTMHQYTREARMQLPEGILKKVVDDYQSSWFGKLFKSIRYYGVYAKRDLQDVCALRKAYAKLIRKKAAEQALASHAQQIESAATLQQKADVKQLHDYVCKQHDEITLKNGVLTDVQHMREDALERMVKGDLSAHTTHYLLHRSTYEMLENAGIDPNAFADFTGNLIQQDTHAKLVHALNSLADKTSLTQQGQLLKDGAIDCAHAGNMLNREGHAAAAMAYTDFCCFIAEKALHFFDNLNPMCRSADTVAWALRIAGAAELAQSFETLRTNIDQFRTGFVVGTLQGATDFKAIYAGLCNTVETVGHFVKFVGEQMALADAIEFGRYDDARAILDANDERIARIATAVHYLTQQATDFVQQMPGMSPEQWRKTGLSTGNFVGREAMQFGIWKAGFSGLCKISQAVVDSVSNFETAAQELILSAHLSGAPSAKSLVDNVARAQRIENVFMQIGSQHITGIAATQPGFGRNIFVHVAQGIKEGIHLADAVGSGTLIWSPTLLQMSKNIESFLTAIKPGCIDLTPKKPTCYKGALLAELQRFNNERLFLGNHTFLIDSKAIKHFLVRHHPSFWEGRIKRNQTFLPKKMSVNDIVATIKQVLNQNRDILIKKGTNSMYQVKGDINGITYVVGTEKGRIAQFYIEKI